MNLKNIRSLLLVGLLVSLVLVNVVKSQDTTADNEEEEFSEDPNATADDATEEGDATDEPTDVSDGGTDEAEANEGEKEAATAEASASAGAAAAVVAAAKVTEADEKEEPTNLPSESAEDQAADKETHKDEEAAAATDAATDAATEEAAAKPTDSEATDAATAAATEAEDAAATSQGEHKDEHASTQEEEKDSETSAPSGSEPAAISFDKTSESSDYGFSTTQDDDHATSDGTAEVAAENNTPSSEDKVTTDKEEGTDAVDESVGGTTPEPESGVASTEKADDEMQTTQEEEESSGDADENVKIGETPICGEGEFQCDSKCFSSSKRCDSVKDCKDGSDEKECSGTDAELTLQVNPDQETITVRVGETLAFTCSARGPFPTIQVLIYKDQVPVDQSDSGSVQLRKDSCQDSDAGQYLCYAFPPDRSSYVVKSINVVVEGGRGGPRPSPPRPGGAKTVDAKVDSNEVLECSLATEENPNVRWTKVNGKLGEYTREYYGKLYIYYLKLEDSGEYECTSEDGRSEKVYLNVYDGDRPPEREPSGPQQPSDTYKYAIRAYVNEPQIRFRNGQTVEQECNVMTNGNNLEIEWYNHRKQLIQNDGRHTVTTTTSSESPLSKVSKLTITDVSLSDSGYYECRARVDNQREAIRFELQSEQAGSVCAIEEATCRNGQCIPRSGLCDGRLDCSDGSDEVNCGGGSSSGRCEPNEKQCRNSKCIQKIWYCDGENDCGDNSDEDQCPSYNAEKKPGEICKTHEFLCRNGQQCVLKGFVCDGEYDCLDQSDESGCEKPTIIRGPIRNMTVYLGRTIRIECEAGGFPAPFINWRLNWGHVCEEPRCVITNENGKGVLTISNARLEDAGAYSCEALNSKGRVFAVPDAIVYVLDDGKYRPIDEYTTPRPTWTQRPPVYPTPPPSRPEPEEEREPARYCDPNGSYTQQPPCQCRPNRDGPRCDRCIDRYFPLHVEARNPFCSPCFCNGLGVECTQASLFYTKIESKFADNDDGWRVDNKFANLTTSLDVKQDGIQFVEFEDFPGEDLFFFAPQKFLGNKLASYGGNLTFSIRYEGQTNGRPKRIEIRIAGSRVNIVHRVNRIFYPYYDYTVNVALTQDEFRRFGDNGRVDREHMLMCLSDIQTIMIRASFVDRQHAVLLKQVSLDYAERYPTSDSDKRAAAIEQCSCPTGYTGLSCETCAPGYKRSSQGGAYLGSCEKSSDVAIAIDLPNNRLNLRAGETRVVDVNIIGPNDGNEQIRWSKDPDSYLPYGVTQQGNNIIFNDANPDMSGTYTATLYTPQGLVKEQLFVTVQTSQPSGSRTPPSIYSPNQRQIDLNIGEPFTLECVARGDPMPSIRIQPPEVRRQPSDVQFANIQQSRPQQQPLARFEITYFTEDNAGTYTCIAENSLGETAVERFVVNARREERGPPTITVEPKRVEAYEGSSVIVNYTYTGSEPVNIKVEQYSAQPQSNSNIYVNKAGKKIDISRISKDMQGQYVVEATNDYGTSSDYFELVVNDAPGPKIMVSETVIRTDVGTTLKIEPKVQYSGRPQFTWTKDGRPLPPNVQVLGYILYVPYVTKENQGVYTLTLVDDYGTAKIQVTIIVDDRVTAAPAPTNPGRIIVKQDMDVDLEAGQNANLVCQIQPRVYNPRVITTTSWVKGMREQRERFPSNIRPNQERLQILRVKPSDAGMYTCVTISSDGSTQTAVVNIRVREGGSTSSGEQTPYRPQAQPPSAQLDTREKQVRVGETFELTCRVSGSPTPRVQWLYNGQPIEEALGDQIAVHAVPGRYTLIVRDVRQDLNGYVVCRATSPANGQSAEDAAVVRALPREEESSEREPAPGAPPTLSVEPREVRARNGEATRLTCRIQNAHPAEFRYQWTKEGGYLPGGSDGESSDVLTLFNLQELDSGVYVCRADNPATGASLQASSRVVVSEEPGSSGEDRDRVPERPREPEQPQEPLKVDVQPKEANLVQGRESEFVCNVQGGSPNRVISWKQTSGQLDPQRHRVEGNRLIISNAQASDRGYFECEVQSGDEVVRDYTRIEIEYREAPKLEIYPNEEQVELDIGGTVYAQCRVVAGIPTPTVEWRRLDGRALSSKVVVSQEGSLLQISDAGNEEIGAYECVARNVEGEASQRLNIVSRGGSSSGGGSYEEEQPRPQPPRRPDEDEREREPYRPRPERPEEDEERPPSVNILTPVVQVGEGETVNLRCETNSAPPFRIDWTGPNGDYLGSSQDGTFSLPNARASDSGTYTCQVTNRYGNKAGTATVTIGDGNPNPNPNPYPYPGGDQQQPEEPGSQQQLLRVQVTPKSRTVTAGTQTDFTCDVQTSGGGEPIIRWSRAGGLQLPAYHQTRGNQLILYNVEPADAGRYQCTAQSADGSIEFDAAYLQVSRVDHSSPFPVFIRVREAPTETFDSLPSFRYGVRLTVECVAQTTEIDSISWSKEEGVSRATYDRVSDTENTMVIPALLSMDLGNYVCIARRSNGEKAQNSIEFKRHPEHGNLFTYDVQGASGPVDEHHQRPYHRPSSGEEEERRGDEQQQPQYPHPDSHQDSASEPPQVSILGSKQVTVNEGDSAEIRCQVIGSNQVEISKHGEPLPAHSRLTQSGNVHILNLHNVRESDRGYYLCNAQNSHGPARDYLYLDVSKPDAQAPPSRDREQEQHDDQQHHREDEHPQQPEQRPNGRESKPLVSVRALTRGAPISLGQELRLACYVDDAEAQVEFARVDGQQDERRVRVEETGAGVRELVIQAFEASDAGNYRCTARNRHGQSQDVGHIEAEADNSFTFKTDKHTDTDVSPGNPHVSIRARSTPREQSPLDIECRLEEENGIPANSYAWSKYPSLPRTGRAEHNNLRIETFENEDNGLYTCRASTDENDYEKTKLITSNDYLLDRNPFFRLTKIDDGIEVKCRPESEHSTYTWRAPEQLDEQSYSIDGDRLIIYQSAAANGPQTFSCHLNTDSEFGPISIDLDVNQELIDRAIHSSHANAAAHDDNTAAPSSNEEAAARLYIDEQRDRDGHNSYLECQPGEDC